MFPTALFVRIVMGILLVERGIVASFTLWDMVLGQGLLVLFQEGGEGVRNSVAAMA